MKTVKTMTAVAAIATLFASGFASAVEKEYKFNVKTEIEPACMVMAGESGFLNGSDIDFGKQNLPDLLLSQTTHLDADNQSASMGLVVACNKGLNYTIALTPSNDSPDGKGVMQQEGGDATIKYSLYQDAARSKAWGNGTNSVTFAGKGFANIDKHKVFARVLTQDLDVPAGNYSDVVTATLSF